MPSPRMTFDKFRDGAGTEYHGVGVYATDIPPEDGATIDEVIIRCFGGDAWVDGSWRIIDDE